MPIHSVQLGECLSSIAVRYGLTWQQIWNHPQNAEFKAKRKNPNVLYVGDKLFVPDKAARTEQAATERRHRFRKKSVPALLRLKLLTGEGKPRKNLRYTLELEDGTRTGSTDGQGMLEEPIDPRAERAVLRITHATTSETYHLHLGRLDPPILESGVEQRLQNLGFTPPALPQLPGVLDVDPLKLFQARHGLPVTGEADSATQQKLQEIHGC